MQVVSSWGRTGRALHDIVQIPDRSSLAEVVRGTPQPALAFGNGRSYGDVCLNTGHSLWAMRGLDRFIAFDPSTGLLACEAGVLLKEIVELVLPHGWFLPVTPGTTIDSCPICGCSAAHRCRSPAASARIPGPASAL